VEQWRRIVAISVEGFPIEDGLTASWRTSGNSSMTKTHELGALTSAMRKEWWA
jgi:hypothetical protein